MAAARLVLDEERRGEFVIGCIERRPAGPRVGEFGGSAEEFIVPRVVIQAGEAAVLRKGLPARSRFSSSRSLKSSLLARSLSSRFGGSIGTGRRGGLRLRPLYVSDVEFTAGLPSAPNKCSFILRL